MENSSHSATTKEENKWYAMRITYQREMQVKRRLEEIGIESYCPMRDELRNKGGKRIKVRVPAIHNLLFVHTSKERLQSVKQRMPELQYMTNREGDKKIIITVPEREMERFIAVTKETDETLCYYTPDEIDIKKGTPIRIHGGALDGIEAIFIKVKGKRSKQVVVNIPGVIAVSTAIVTPDLIEVIKEESKKSNKNKSDI